jgi:DNA-binding transcriptional ArsR family regulator
MSNHNTYHIFFSNLSNPLRIDVISALKEKSFSVSELGKKLVVEQSKLSHALSNLKECNIVSVRQKGKERIYSLNKKTILPILKLIDKHAQLNCTGECKNCIYK